MNSWERKKNKDEETIEEIMDKIFGSVGALMQDGMQGHGAKEVVCGKGGKMGNAKSKVDST